MTTLQNIEQKGTAAVKRLRKQKLAKGFPFMINSSELPSNQSYLEFPDGTIQLVALSPSKRDFDIIRQLSSAEATALRQKLRLTL